MTVAESHLSIGEVLALLQEEFPDITISKIRFLESQGLLDPERTPSGYRKFYEPDIERLRWILREQREHFLPLKVIKDRLEGKEATADALDLSGPGAGDAPPSSADGGFGVDREADPSSDFPTTAGEGAVPVWMADVTRRQAARAEAADPLVAERPDGRSGPARTPLDAGPSSVSLTVEELASAAGLSQNQIRELERYGLLEGRHVGDDVVYDGDALVVAQKAAALFKHGLAPRHLRTFKLDAEREAALLEQLVLPLLKQRSASARRQAVLDLANLAGLGEELRGALMRQALRQYLTVR